jgi:hypothetical protein
MDPQRVEQEKEENAQEVCNLNLQQFVVLDLDPRISSAQWRTMRLC